MNYSMGPITLNRPTRIAPSIVFDLDGTLVDSANDLIPALNKTICAEGLKPVAKQDATKVVGQGAAKMIELAYKLNDVSLAQEKLDELFKQFLKHYENHIADETIFFDGCLSALDRLSVDGWQFSVCTNKLENLAVKLLTQMQEEKRFITISGGDTFEHKKPHPSHILETIKRAGANPTTSIMVGDSINDIAAAKAANVPSIAVDFGYTEQPVTEMGADIVISHFDEFYDAVQEIASRW